MVFNRIKAVILLATLSGLLMAIGGLIGGTLGIQMALVMALIFNGIAYFFSDKIVLRMYNAQPLDPTTYGWIHTMVAELAADMSIPVPTLWLLNTPIANAFATGRNPSHASVALTKSIINILDADELRGVLAHELSHVKNRDILVTTIAATIATAIGYLATMLRWSAMWGGGSGDSRRKDSNPIVLMLVGIIMPFAALLIQLAISRSREYLADETGADCCRDPLALASALEKLNNYAAHGTTDAHAQDPRYASTASLFIVNPFTDSSWATLFSTHPPMSKRIARLRALSTKMFHTR
jgi:heat shock protein HtpX